MSEDTTKNLDRRSFEERVLAEFAAMRNEFATMRNEFATMRNEFATVNAHLNSLDARLTSLEEKVDARLRETRPIWEAMQATLDDLTMQVQEMLGELFRTRTRVGKLEERWRPPAA